MSSMAVMVKGSLTVTLLSFLKSITMRILPSFFLTGIGGLAHLDTEGSMTPKQMDNLWFIAFPLRGNGAVNGWEQFDNGKGSIPRGVKTFVVSRVTPINYVTNFEISN